MTVEWGLFWCERIRGRLQMRWVDDVSKHDQNKEKFKNKGEELILDALEPIAIILGFL